MLLIGAEFERASVAEAKMGKQRRAARFYEAFQAGMMAWRCEIAAGMVFAILEKALAETNLA